MTETRKLADHVDFNVFFRLNCRGFKNRLINELEEWGLLFKEYLKNQVINGLQVSKVFFFFAIFLDFLDECYVRRNRNWKTLRKKLNEFWHLK